MCYVIRRRQSDLSGVTVTLQCQDDDCDDSGETVHIQPIRGRGETRLTNMRTGNSAWFDVSISMNQRFQRALRKTNL